MAACRGARGSGASVHREMIPLRTRRGDSQGNLGSCQGQVPAWSHPWEVTVWLPRDAVYAEVVHSGTQRRSPSGSRAQRDQAGSTHLALEHPERVRGAG